jgi:antitoxin (DNA-binding transcriptional repressor) of toxin-antitoxin stability system
MKDVDLPRRIEMLEATEALLKRLREVSKSGRPVVVVDRGRPLVKIEPAPDPVSRRKRKAARAALRKAARKGMRIGYGRIDRAALYERGW